MGAALITGSSRGIGRACAELFARRGLDVVVHYRRDAEAARAVVAAVEAHGRRAVAVRAELADADEVAGLADAAIEAFGTLDVVVANAAASAF
ncbi:MAG: SDR family NAD(P)-dependent oxidoreductase, partial [Acidimicrobiia bacterium]|nr:SDR family NAD(P)-dependent oxidoreductase [Acidimicrobiia bacterium]